MDRKWKIKVSLTDEMAFGKKKRSYTFISANHS